ncbi:2-methylacyl-CoA dehydrogenase, mitochondrial [Leucoagaricus sp. SymC.cos]|nr:2-methylacyl-CoA dehydrogenase, mitochondrial [Leucoagaricus sp. SymC.cos]
MSKQFTKEEVAKHNKDGDLWVVVDSKVYDLSRFAKMHPGGLAVLLDSEVAGQDATEAFFSLHRYEVLQKPQYSRLTIGTLVGAKQQIFPKAVGGLSNIPYAEPTWLTSGYHSPYYNDHHRKFQAAFRRFVEEVVFPDAWAREEDGKQPSPQVHQEMARMNILAMRLGPGSHLKGRTLMGGIVKPEEFDCFHELIMSQEMARIHARGYDHGLSGGTFIGLPAVVNFGRPELRDRVMKEVLDGKKHLCLAITEAFSGSDVAGLKCLAKRVENGWVVTGTKKWITNGTFADYFVVGCRTEKSGLVVLFVERGEGVETKPIKTSYSATAGTAYVTFENVFVPYEHTLGSENDGFRVILSNFNHERWGMVAYCVGGQRAIIEECMKWINQRKVFGKPLHSQAVIRSKLATSGDSDTDGGSQAVIRSKLAGMFARVESAQNWLENITYQMNHMSYKDQSRYLAGSIGLLKKFATESAQETARDAVQIFGGRGITRTGMGRFIEHYHRTISFDAVLGGTEDVLGDLGVRQALNYMPKNTRL